MWGLLATSVELTPDVNLIVCSSGRVWRRADLGGAGLAAELAG